MLGKFKIEEITIYEPELKIESIQLEKEEKYNSNLQLLEIENEIYISQKAKETIFNHISWGKDTKRNSVEQGGLLIGYASTDRESKVINAYAKEAIPAFTAKGSMAYLEFDHGTWKSMMDTIDIINDNHQGDDYQIIGWYHTHPGRLSVFMSGTDLNTQRKMFYKDWQFAIVLNPQKQVWRAFNGKEAKECKGQILK
jgi:proteasome lid subunit RPN8/RPN11